MIDCRIAKIASSGIRGTRFRFRQVMTAPSFIAARSSVMRPSPRPPAGSSSAAWPVSARKTSSSVGRRKAMSSTRRSASSSRRMTSTSCVAPPSAAIVIRRTCSSTVAPPSGASSCAARPRSAALVHDHLDSLAADARLELVGGAARDDLALVDDGDLARELVRLLEVLRRQEQRRALAHLRPDHVPHAEAAARVEARRRLVEEEQARPADQRRGEVEPAPHPAGVRLRDAVGSRLEVELRQQLVGPRPRRCAREVVQAAEHPEVLAAGQVLVDRRVLAGEPDRLPDRLRLAQHVEAGDPRAAGVRPEQRREDAHGRRLAGAVRAEQPEHGALLHLEVDAVERAHLALARAVDLDETLCFDGGHRHPAYVSAPRCRAIVA